MSDDFQPKPRVLTKAYACTCAPHQQPNCSYWRMGYCSDKWNGSDVPTPPRLRNRHGLRLVQKPALHVIPGGKK